MALGIPVYRDFNEIAYGNRLVIFVDNWAREEYRIMNLDVPVTNAMKTAPPIFYYCCRYGMRIIHWWAAVMGCDISKKESGIVGAGRGVFVNTLRNFDDKEPATMNPRRFATKLRQYARPQCRFSYSVAAVAQDLQRVAQWFTTGGTYYNDVANVRSVAGSIIQVASTATLRHMRGDLNPKTSAEFTNKERRLIDAIQPYNLVHDYAACGNTITGVSLPMERSTVVL